MNTLPYSYGGLGNTEIRVRLASLLSELLPDSITGLLFPSGSNDIAPRTMHFIQHVCGVVIVVTRAKDKMNEHERFLTFPNRLVHTGVAAPSHELSRSGHTKRSQTQVFITCAT